MKEISKLIPSIYNKFVKINNSEKFSTSIPEVTVNEEYYLEILCSLGKPTFTEFAEKAEITRPAASQIIKKLADKGYVEKVQSKKDKRVYFIKTNNEIKNYFQECDIYLDEIYESCLSLLNKNEKYHFKNILAKINVFLHEIENKEFE